MIIIVKLIIGDVIENLTLFLLPAHKYYTT